MVVSLADAMTQAGHLVDLISVHDAPPFWAPETAPIHILGFKKQLFRYRIFGAKLRRLVDKLESGQPYDLIFSHLELSTRLVKVAGLTAYHVVHSAMSLSIIGQRRGLRRVLKMYRKVRIYNDLNLVFVSEGVGRDLISCLTLTPRSVHTLTPGVDFERIRMQAIQPVVVPEDYIVHVGRLDGVKRHDLLIRAYAQSGLLVPLLLVGEGHERGNIERLITELNLRDRVRLLGAVANPYPYINHASMLIVASDHEGFGIVLVEALCLGVPVISTDCPTGPRSILGEHLREQLVPVNDIQALAAKMLSTYRQPPQVNADWMSSYSLKQVAEVHLQLPALSH